MDNGVPMYAARSFSCLSIRYTHRPRSPFCESFKTYRPAHWPTTSRLLGTIYFWLFSFFFFLEREFKMAAKRDIELWWWLIFCRILLSLSPTVTGCELIHFQGATASWINNPTPTRCRLIFISIYYCVVCSSFFFFLFNSFSPVPHYFLFFVT